MGHQKCIILQKNNIQLTKIAKKICIFIYTKVKEIKKFLLIDNQAVDNNQRNWIQRYYVHLGKSDFSEKKNRFFRNIYTRENSILYRPTSNFWSLIPSSLSTYVLN